MSWAKDNLGADERRNIASQCFEVKSERGAELHGLCPFHDDGEPSFSYNADKDVYNCLACSASGDLVSLWGHVNGHGDNKEAFLAFKGEFGDPNAHKQGPGKNKAAQGRSGAKNKAKEPPIIPEADLEALPPLPERWLKGLEQKRGWRPDICAKLGLRLFADGDEERVAIPVRDEDGKLRNIRLYRPGASKGKKIRSWAKGHGESRLFPAPPLPAGPIWICEGEPDTICAISHGLNAVCHTTGAGNFPSKHGPAFAGRDVIICYDADDAGRDGAYKVAQAVVKQAASVKILRWPEFMTDAQDLTDWFKTHGKSVAQLKDLLPSAEVYAKPNEPEDEPENPWRFFVKNKSGGMTYKESLLATEIIAEQQLATDPDTGLTYRWTGRYWEWISREHIAQMGMRKLMGEGTAARGQAVAQHVAIRTTLPPGDSFDGRPDLLCLENGMLDLDTLEVRPHAPEFRATYMHPWPFDPHAPVDCPVFKGEYLAQAIQDPGAIRDLQEFAGYCLWPGTHWPKALFLIGPGSDGKSTLLKVLAGLVGEERCSSVNLADLEDQFQRVSLHGKALNTFAEASASFFESTFFKAVTSGDSIQAAYKHRDSFMFKPSCKLAFSANEFPRVRDNTFAFYRRILPIEFPKQFLGSDADPFLENKLLAELPGIFAWAIVGLWRLRHRGGWDHSPAVKAVLNGYRKDNNPLESFLEEVCTLKPAYEGASPPRVEKDDLFNAWQNWCKASGHKAGSKERFCMRLYAIHPRFKNYGEGWEKYTTDDGKRSRRFIGLGLRTVAAAP